MPDTITVVSSLLLSAVTSGGLGWLTKKWISIRLENSIKSEYEQKLAKHKEELRKETEMALARFKSAYDKELETHRSQLREQEGASLERLKLETTREVETYRLQLTQQINSKLEILKSGLQVAAIEKGASSEEYRTAFREFTAGITSMLHSMCWLTWDAKTRKKYNPDMMKKYDDEVHILMPRIIGNLAVMASLSAIHEELTEFVEKMLRLDSQIGEAAVACEERSENVGSFNTYHAEALALENTYRNFITGIFHSRLAVGSEKRETGNSNTSSEALIGL
jgi:hypothetical protein